MATMTTAVSINSKMIVSVAGSAAISKDEGFSSHPYNDQAKHCTVGTGMLIHKGPCTVEELKKTYDPSTLQESYKSRLQEAQNYVTHYVRDSKLTQDQFDALSSFVFNVGVGNAKQTLGLVNNAENEKAAAEMSLFVNVKVKDKNGKVTLTRSNGLTTRRVRETTPFITPKPAK